MSEDLFSDEKEVTYEDLVGEGKKFKDNDSIAKKVIHADKHISTLEQEMAELRAELTTRLTVEEMMEKMQKPKAEDDDARRTPDMSRQEPGSKDIDIAAEVQRILKEETTKQSREKNISTVRKELKDRFGADYNSKLTQIAEQLETTPAFLNDMATKSPNGFLKLIDSVAQKDNNKPATPPSPGVNSGASIPDGTKKNAAYYKQLRKEDAAAYFSKKVQSEMHKQAVEMGSAFYES